MTENTGFIEPSPQLKAHDLALLAIDGLIEESKAWTAEQQAYLLAVLARYAAERASELLNERAVRGEPLRAMFWRSALELAGGLGQSAGVLADLIEHTRHLEQPGS